MDGQDEYPRYWHSLAVFVEGVICSSNKLYSYVNLRSLALVNCLKGGQFARV